MKLKVFHGTAINKPDDLEELPENIIFENLETGYSDLNTVWFSQNKGVSEHFSKSAMGKVEDGIQIILEGELTLDDDKVYTLEPGARIVTLNDCDYDIWQERDELYEALQDSGYEAFIIENNYPTEGLNADDIAVFDESCFEVKSAQIKTDDKWSLSMSEYDQLESVLAKAFFGDNVSLDEDASLSC